VAAIPHNPQRAADGRANRAGYRITYHPSAPDAEHAMPVMVNVRARQTADIIPLPAALATISGVVLDSKGSPVSQANVHIAHGDHLFGINRAAGPARSDGTFSFAGFPADPGASRSGRDVKPPAGSAPPCRAQPSRSTRAGSMRDARRAGR
jgi:hypothetical protein